MITGNRTRFDHHKYTRFSHSADGAPQHQWSVVGPAGAVVYTAYEFRGPDGESVTCGLDFHFTRAASKFPNDAPHHLKCEFTGEPCWHDGTSTYATDVIWPTVKAALAANDHATIFHMLEAEYVLHF